MEGQNQQSTEPAIPARLQRTDLRFCLILRGKKAPFEQGWQETANYVYNDPRLLSHLSSGGNYGIVCGFGNLAVVDCDSSEVVTAVETDLPETFTVKTGRGNKHFYYFVEGMTDPIRMRDKEGKAAIGHLGDVQFTGKQVVGVNSIHPNGHRYEVEKDAPIATIKISQLRAALADFIKDDTETEKMEETAELSKGGLDFGTLNISDVINTSGLKKKGSAFQGAHPVHGSDTGSNFRIDTAKNLWSCYRHSTGGGILSLIAVVNGVMDCQDARPGGLRGDKFKAAVEVAKTKHGLKVVERQRKKKSGSDKEGKSHGELADELMTDYIFKTMKDTLEIYRYNPEDGIYHNDGERVIEQDVVSRTPDVTTHFTEQVKFTIRAKTYTDREKFDNDPKKLHLKNGIFNIDKMEVEPFSPDILSTVAIPVTFDATKDCPASKKFIAEVLMSQDIPIIQQLFGYCILKMHHIQRAFLFVGLGANGKSVLLSLLKSFVGKRNVSNMPLQSFDTNRFASSSLMGKMANIYADLPDKAMKYTGQFKTLTGGDDIPAEKKFKEGYSFQNFAKLIFSCNKVPDTEDESEAFFRRWIILNFPHTFDGKKADKHLIDKLTTDDELSGLFNWAVEGLKYLLKEGDFSYSLTTQQTMDRYQRLASSLHAFIKDCVDVDPDGFIPKEDFYSVYVVYCQKSNLPIMASNTVGRDLPKYVAMIRAEKRKVGTERKNVWVGIKIIPKEEIQATLETPQQAKLGEEEEPAEQPACDGANCHKKEDEPHPDDEFQDEGKDVL